MKTLLKTILLSLGLLSGFALSAQQKQLSEEEIWKNNIRLTEPSIRITQWMGSKVVFSGGGATGANRTVSIADAKTGKITPFEGNPYPAAAAEWKWSIADGDIYLQKPGKAREKITGTPEEEKNPTLSPDSLYLAFTRHNDLYTIRLSDKKETRLTTDGSDVILNGHASWVYMEEILGRAGQYRAFWWSPDSKHIAFFRSDERQVPLFTVTDATGQHGYVETLRYPKAGDPIPQVKTGIVSPDGGAIVWAAIDEKDSHYFGLPYWRPDGKALWLQWLNYEQNHLKIVEVDLASGTAKELYHEQQKTWISIDDEPRMRFLESGKGFILQSDKSGWNQLYLHDMNGMQINPITSGNYTVLEVLRVDEKEKTVYFTCFKDNIGCEDFYKVGLDGKNLQRLSFGNYSHRIALSPDGKYFVTTYSNISTPRKTDLYSTKGKFICQLQDTKTPNLDIYERPKVEFVVLKSNDGKFDLPMRIVWPLNMEKGKTYPVKLNIYGGPGALRVRADWIDAFGGEAHKLAQDGLISVMIDHRGSGHNGKAGQEYMHRNLGYWEMEDYTQCVKWLIAERQADPKKIMITGFSYGGYLTCYALTYGADVFTHGIAGGSVTDWKLYDATYTERFMDTPKENPEGYKTSSVLENAGKLQGKLLLTHGLRDENVHVQNTFQLVSQFENMAKDFELMIYPECRHGYLGTKLNHSRNIEAQFLYKYLFEKPVPEQMLKRGK